ncbi:MAG: GtrA family protein [Candidatus Pacearchaeota archaeon]|jgi:putative flippase GtrA
MIKKTIDKAIEYKFIRYVLVGGFITLIDWALFFILAKKLGLYYQFALVIGFSIASICHYSLSKLFTFRCKSNKIGTQFSVFVLIAIGSLLLNMLLMFFFIDIMTLEKMTSRVITTFIMLFVNYSMNSYITFNKKIFKN